MGSKPDLVQEMLKLFRELETHGRSETTGPSMQDSIYGQMLWLAAGKSPSRNESERARKLTAFFDRCPETEAWVRKMLASVESRKNLLVLLRVAMD